MTSSLNELFDVDLSLDIDDTDFDLVEPRSDVRWQRKRMVLPLDRPLPQVAGQAPAADWAVTPVLETASPTPGADSLIPETVIPLVEDFAPFEVLGEIKPAIPEPLLSAPQETEWTLVPELADSRPQDEAPAATATADSTAPHPVIEATIVAAPSATLTPEPAPGPTAAEAAAAAVAQTAAQIAAETPVAPIPMTPAVPVSLPGAGTTSELPEPLPKAPEPEPAPEAQPEAPAQPEPEAQAEAASEEAPASPTSEPASTPAPIPAAPTPEPTVTLATPVQEIVVATPPGALLTDTSLDIDESDDEDYYDDDDDEREGKLSGPLFILILFLILVVQVLFIGFLFSIGVLDIGAFGIATFNPTIIG
jgi:hypothetical protein